MGIRLWISQRYAASDWFRLLSTAVVVAVNIAFMWGLIALQRQLEMPEWLATTILIVWTLALAGFWAWLCTARLDREAA